MKNHGKGMVIVGVNSIPSPRLRWIIGKLACEEAGNRLMEVARFFGRYAGVMSRGLRLLEDRLAEEKELHRPVDRLRRVMCEGRKGRTAKRQDT